jgi:hypothetical protein
VIVLRGAHIHRRVLKTGPPRTRGANGRPAGTGTVGSGEGPVVFEASDPNATVDVRGRRVCASAGTRKRFSVSTHRAPLSCANRCHRDGQLKFFGERVDLADTNAFADWLMPLLCACFGSLGHDRESRIYSTSNTL